MQFRGLIALMLIAAAPVPDFVALVRSGHPPDFKAVLDARFGTSGRERFDAFHEWATGRLTPEDRARISDPGTPGPDGKPQWKAKPGGCQAADLFGHAHAMALVVAAAKSREAALAGWAEVERVLALASSTEAQKLAEARKLLDKRTTQTGRELALRVASDQAWREAQFDRPHDETEQEAIAWELHPRLCHIDHDDTAFLKSVIAHAGWPIISRDGVDSARDAWLLAQHADADPAFQRQVLTLLLPLVAKHEVDGKNYALLYDRVAIADHRQQRYGTQFTDTKQGCLVAQETEDHAGVDLRRNAVGLDTLAEYGKRLSEAYKHAVCANIFADGKAH